MLKSECQRVLMMLSVAASALAARPAPVLCLPDGRVWAPTVELQGPSVTEFAAPRLEADSLGNPYLIIAEVPVGESDQEWSLYRWVDSSWADPTRTRVHASWWPVPVVSPLRRPFLLWLDYTGLGFGTMAFSEFTDSGLVAVDTAMVAWAQDSEYGGAVSESGRRWVTRSRQRSMSEIRYAVFTAFSDSFRVWHQLPVLGVNEDLLSIAPLGRDSAIVAYAGVSGLVWAITDGRGWVGEGSLDSRAWLPLHPRFRLRPSGGLWLTWSDREVIRFATFRSGEWVDQGSVAGRHAPGETYIPAWIDVSRDTSELPVIGWGDLGYGYTRRNIGMVAVPTASGYTNGEEIPGSQGVYGTPMVTRDRNGDVWAAWQRLNGGVFFTHTYCSATASRPVIQGAGRHRRVSWTLSSPAEGSRWTVLRSRDGASFDSVACLRASGQTTMAWQDDSPPRGLLAYRIRRESVDKRYEWLSEEARWPRTGRRPLKLAFPDVIDEATLGLLLEDAPMGAVDLELYDLQGRLIGRQQAVVERAGVAEIRFDLSGVRGRLPSGVYFVRATDATGMPSNAVKFVLLR